MDTQQTQIKEEWRPVVGYEGLYIVSNTGRVKAINFHREKREEFIKVHNKNGYNVVCLYKHGNPVNSQVHRIVGMAFIPNPNNYPCINHKDENPQNNCVDNLEWCSYKYNSNYGTSIERSSSKKKKVIVQLTKNWEEITRYTSFKEAQEKTGLQYSNISKVCRGLREFCGGYRWKYIDKQTENRAKRKTKEEKELLLSRKKRKTVYESPVIQYTKNGEKIKEYETIYDASKETSVARRVIVDNCRGVNKTTRNFIFKFKE